MDDRLLLRGGAEIVGRINWEEHVKTVEEQIRLNRDMVAKGRIPFDREKLAALYRDLEKVEKMAGAK